MAAELAVTDTHSMLWYGDPRAHRKLGRRALAHFRRTAEGAAAIYVPALVLVEIGELAHRARIALALPFDAWLDDLLANRCYIVEPLTEPIVRVAQQLFDIPERGDRLIAATAVARGVPLMTRDAAIAECARVERLW